MQTGPVNKVALEVTQTPRLVSHYGIWKTAAGNCRQAKGVLVFTASPQRGVYPTRNGAMNGFGNGINPAPLCLRLLGGGTCLNAVNSSSIIIKCA